MVSPTRKYPLEKDKRRKLPFGYSRWIDEFKSPSFPESPPATVHDLCVARAVRRRITMSGDLSRRTSHLVASSFGCLVRSVRVLLSCKMYQKSYLLHQ